MSGPYPDRRELLARSTAFGSAFLAAPGARRPTRLLGRKIYIPDGMG